MIYHCGMNFEEYNIWYLEPANGFERRELRLGICPVCGNNIVILSETRVTDGKHFSSYIKAKHQKNVIEREESRKLYTLKELRNSKKKLSGGSMGLIQQSKERLAHY
ncbi:MAG: hypothetical protein LBK53_09425 [Heliobacteriaceae bacterium]|nr:hypothetical protein [Heliobacteriaceae bacterium]